MSQIKVRDIDDRPLTLINTRLSLGHASSEEAYDDKFSDFAGNLAFPTPLPSNDGYSLHLNYQNVEDEFESKSIWVPDLNPKGNPDDPESQNIKVYLARKERERAHIDGYFSNVFMKGESAFLDLYRLILGQDIRPLLRQSVDMGSNGRRNFMMTYNTAQAAGLPPFNPDNHIDYYNFIEELLNLYGEYGLYLYGCIFPDNGLFDSWRGNTQKQIEHWNRIGSIAQKHNNFWGLELTNEINSKSFNQVEQSRFSPIPGVISCSGSWTDDSGNSLDFPIQWDVCDFHQRRNYPKSVVDSCIANYPPREQWHKATGLGEPVGFGDKNLNGNREDNPRIAKEIAGSSRGTAAFLIYHTQHGGLSQMYDDTEIRCGQAWFNELQGV